MMTIYPPFSIPNSLHIPLPSKQVKDTFQIHLLLPASFEQNRSTYPVLVLLDSDDVFAMLSTLAVSLFYENLIPEMIVAGIGYGIGMEGVADGKNHRERDYLPVSDDTRPDVDQAAGASNFFDFIHLELLPYLETHFRADPHDRSLVGISFGGVFGLYTLFCHPGIFQRYLVSSPSLAWGHRVTEQFEKDYDASHTDMKARLYLSSGTWEKSLVADMQNFYDLLYSRRYPALKMNLSLEEGGHLSSQAGALTRGLIYLYKDMCSSEAS
jgi:uncharacterized protein